MPERRKPKDEPQKTKLRKVKEAARSEAHDDVVISPDSRLGKTLTGWIAEVQDDDQ